MTSFLAAVVVDIHLVALEASVAPVAETEDTVVQIDSRCSTVAIAQALAAVAEMIALAIAADIVVTW